MSTDPRSQGTIATNQEEISRLRQLIMGFRITQLIYVAAKLGLADHLARKPQTAQDLASLVDAEPSALYRLLRALAGVGVFAVAVAPLCGSRWGIAATGQGGSLRSTAMLYGDELIWNAYGQLTHAIKTGEPAFDHVYGQPFYDYLSQHPAPAALFHEAMTGFRNKRPRLSCGL
jgi:hypothetical protein